MTALLRIPSATLPMLQITHFALSDIPSTHTKNTIILSETACRNSASALPEDKKDDTDKMLELFSEYYGEHFLDKTKLYPQIRETLHKLADSGVKLAVATNKPENFAVKITDALLPEISFVKVLGGNSKRPKKPDTAILDEIFAALPDEENRAFMIGDSNVDIQTGKNAGIETIGCVWGFRGRQELEDAGADHIANTADDIAKFILE